MTDALDQLRVLVQATEPLLTLVGVNHASNWLEVEALDDWPRVVWVNAGGDIGPPMHVGGRPIAAPNTRVNQHYSDVMEVDFHIWGEDLEAARNIMHALCAGCWEVAHGWLEFGGYKVVTQEEPVAEYAKSGQKMLLQATFQLPISEAADSITVIATQRHRGDFIDPQTGAITTGICET